MNEELTPRELHHLIKDISTDVKEVVVQVRATNGRVSRLENWQAFMKGGLAVLSILVVPIVIYVITHAR